MCSINNAKPGGPMVSALLDRFGFRHGFFTRYPGHSAGPFAAANFGTSAGDDPDVVDRNFAEAAAWLGVCRERVVVVHQVHGVQTYLARMPVTRTESQGVHADAVLSVSPEIACGVRSADCVPVLLADMVSGAGLAVHAGWRGVAQNIVQHAIRDASRSLADLGQQPCQWLAAVGPHIEQCCFEVDTPIAETLAQCAPLEQVVVSVPGRKPHVSLRRILHYQLRQAGVAADHIDHIAGCTKHNPEQFFSYRRDGAVSGRHLSAIVARR